MSEGVGRERGRESGRKIEWRGKRGSQKYRGGKDSCKKRCYQQRERKIA